MVKNSEQWNKWAIKKFGSIEAGREHMRKMQKASRETYKGTGGFHALKKNDPEQLLRLQKKGYQAMKSKLTNGKKDT